MFDLKGSLIDVVSIKNVDNYTWVNDLSKLACGVYILKVLTPHESKAFKIIVQ